MIFWKKLGWAFLATTSMAATLSSLYAAFYFGSLIGGTWCERNDTCMEQGHEFATISTGLWGGIIGVCFFFICFLGFAIKFMDQK